MPTLDEQIVLAISADITNLRRAVVQMGGVIQQMATQQANAFKQIDAAATNSANTQIAQSTRVRNAVVQNAEAAAAASTQAMSRSSAFAANNARNLSFQINDVMSALASGQGIRGVAQQFSQIAQSFTGTGIVETITAMATRSNLLVLGLTAAATAATYFFSKTEDKGKEAEAVLKDHADAIRALKDAYGDAAKGVEEFAKVSKDVALGLTTINSGVLRLEQKISTSDFFKGDVFNVKDDKVDLSDLIVVDQVKLDKRIDQLRKYLQEQTKRMELGAPNFDEAGMKAAQANLELLDSALGQLAGGYAAIQGLPQEFSQAIMDLSVSALDGSADFIKFQETLTKLADTVPGLTDEQLKLIKAMYDAADAGAKQQAALEANAKAIKTVTVGMQELLVVVGALATGFPAAFANIVPVIEEVIKKLGGVNEIIRQISSQLSGLAGMVTESWDKAGAAISSAADLIKQREGFRSHAYWDVNHYRVGFGSDKYVDEMGKIQDVTRDTVVTLDQANTDLNRRIQEFQQTIVNAIGPALWADLSEKQQAALTDLTYNYGHLPESVAAAIKSGDSGQVARAIQALGGANAGINRERRNQEAQLYAEGGAFAKSATSVGELTDAQKAENDETRTRLKLSGDLTKAIDQETYDRVYASELSSKMAKAEQDARERGVPLTKEEISLIQQQAAETANLAAQEAASKAAKEGAKSVAERIQAMKDENAELEKKAELMGTSLSALEDNLTASERQTAIAEGAANALAIENDYKRQHIDLTKEDTAAIEEQQQKLALAKAGLKDFGKEAKDQSKEIQQFASSFASSIGSAISGFISDLRNGKSAGEAFNNMLNKIIDSLIDMAIQMLIVKPLTNMLSGMLGGGGGGGGLFSFAERGGEVGKPGPKRRGDPRWFIGAPSFATGGMVLPHGAVPIIAHAGEVVLPKGAKVGGGGNVSVGSIVTNINPNASGAVISTTDQGRQLGKMVDQAVQGILLKESRPGGILRRQPA